MIEQPEGLRDVDRLGWIDEPSPVENHDEAVDGTGCDHLFVKRDDLLAALHGGTKPRKLDYLLAAEPYASADGWHSMGGIGSGHLVALGAAADRLDRELHAHCFWQPTSDDRVVENLRFTASQATHVEYYSSRVTMAIRHPRLFLASALAGLPIIPPGGTTLRSMLGLVRAALELRAQIDRGELPEPDATYVALGTGGTAVGLAVGFGLAGIETTIHAVATVERPIATRRRLDRLTRALVADLSARGLDVTPVPMRVDRNHLGAGYGVPTEASRAACERLNAHGVELCQTYTSKAFAALLRDADSESIGTALFWLTGHSENLPFSDDWRSRLPDALTRRLDENGGRRIGRRKVLIGGVAAAAAVGLGGTLRLTWYDTSGAYAGEVLSRRESLVLRAAAEALLHPAPSTEEYDEIVERVDQFLAKMPGHVAGEVHTMLTFVEQATPLGLYLRRASSLDRDDRERYLESLANAGGLLQQAYRGLRDLCLLGYYQQESAWSEMGYGGPLVSGERPRAPKYDALCASADALPAGARR